MRTAALVLTLLAALGVGQVPAAPAKITVIALFKDKAMVMVDGKRRMLRQGETSPEGVTLVSADAEKAVLEVDGREGEYKLGAQISSAFQGPERRTVRIWPTRNGMYAVTGTINSLPVDFIVDTGATLVSMNAPAARRLGIDYRVVGEPAVSTTASGRARIYLVHLRHVQVGEIRVKNVRGAVHDGNFPQEILLGQSFLNRLDMHRDGDMLELVQEQ